MADPRRTQKQIAERYKGNLGYYKKLHPWRRARLLVSSLTILGGLLALCFFYKRAPEKFFNPGALSSHHAALPQSCDDCHDKTLITGGRLTSEKFKEVVHDSFRRGVAFERTGGIDKKCEDCHLQRSGRPYTFHQASVVENRSCSACHQEHQGLASLKAVASSQCIACHGNSAVMEASARKGMQIEPGLFHRHPHPPQQVAFELPRPAQGFTRTFQNFWTDHPEFQINREKTQDPKVRDPDALRFNHQRHFAADIPAIDKQGTKLDCNYCHKADTEGRFMRRITFAANCQMCHSLQFDLHNPELTLPHGNSTAVLGFLRSLPTHYEELALSKGMTTGQIRPFVEQQRGQLRAQFGSDEELIRAVFFTSDPYKPHQRGGAQTRASFSGCRLCHEVTPAAVGAPVITRPILVDRWMLRSDFDHARHASVKCDDCHHASQSRDTADILMPVKADCVTCHSPIGKVAAECITCHRYHAPGQALVVDAHGATSVSVKQMLLGQK
jgi:hypothetical protein